MFTVLLGIYIPRSGLAGSCGDSVFNLMRSHQTFSKVAVPLTFLPAVSPRLPQHWLLPVLLILIATLVGVECCLPVALICFSLMTNDVERLFMCIWAICMSLEDIGFYSWFHHFAAAQL